MEDLEERGHVARWTGSHFEVVSSTGIELGAIEPVDGAWQWVEYKTEYDRGVDMAPGSFREPADALHAMLEWGGGLV